MVGQEDQFSVLTRVSAGTPMGNLFRRFWLPALLASELPEPDGAPIRLRILGEDLIAFRDTEGRIGIVGAYCPHKMAPLFFGRNEACGLRCVYHGWKFNVDGDCVEIPNITPPDNFETLKQRMRLKSYPAREAGGLIWVYMGPKEQIPELPEMAWLDLPKEHIHVSRWLHRSNWLQAVEGEIDTSHISFLHSVLDPDPDGPDRLRLARDGAPEIIMRETDYGFYYGARRRFGERLRRRSMTFWAMGARGCRLMTTIQWRLAIAIGRTNRFPGKRSPILIPGPSSRRAENGGQCACRMDIRLTPMCRRRARPMIILLTVRCSAQRLLRAFGGSTSRTGRCRNACRACQGSQPELSIALTSIWSNPICRR